MPYEWLGVAAGLDYLGGRRVRRRRLWIAVVGTVVLAAFGLMALFFAW